jgi:hypothetical protein
MRRRIPGVGLVVLVSCLLVGSGTASARAGSAGADPGKSNISKVCTVKSLRSFVLQGEFARTASAADVIEVSCDPLVYGTGSRITISDNQLFLSCAALNWIVPNNGPLIGPGPSAPPGFSISGSQASVTVNLDAAGNANVALIAGPDCSAGETLVAAHMAEEPFDSSTATFTLLPTKSTPPGLKALPASQVEDATSSAVVTIVEAEFRGGSEKPVRIGAEELFSRCRAAPKLHFIKQQESGGIVTLEDLTGVSEIGGASAIPLDNAGNGFVVLVGDSSCAPGPSLIEADLQAKPMTTYTTRFTVKPPKRRK